MKSPWLFTRCDIGRVIDGDSLTLVIDTGFYHSATVHVRLLGVDTPERGRDAEKWRTAREYCRNWIIESGKIVFECYGPDKYGGRWLGKIINSEGESLSDALISAGLGVQYDGGKKA